MYQFRVEPPRPRLRTWVCPSCETGGKSPRPVVCEWCGQPAVDVGPEWVAMHPALITRHVRRARDTR